MADKIIYVFYEQSPYICDNGFTCDWSGTFNIWFGFSFTQMATIANAAGAVAFTSDNSPKHVNDLIQKKFDARYARFKFNDQNGINGQMDVILRDPDTVVARANAIALAIEALGMRVNRVDLMGEVWRDIYDFLAPPVKDITPGARYNARKRYNNRIRYESDLGPTWTEKVSMQGAANYARPAGLEGGIDSSQAYTNRTYSNETGRPSPRHFVIETKYTDTNGADRSQKTKVNVSFTSSDQILEAGELFAANVATNRMTYYGERCDKIETLFATPI